MSGETTRGSVFWVEAGLATLATGMMVLTLVNREWIEWLTGSDPDGRDGILGWAVVSACFVAALLFGTLARRELLRVRPTS